LTLTHVTLANSTEETGGEERKPIVSHHCGMFDRSFVLCG
jgi:hypothetical protein